MKMSYKAMKAPYFGCLRATAQISLQPQHQSFDESFFTLEATDPRASHLRKRFRRKATAPGHDPATVFPSVNFHPLVTSPDRERRDGLGFRSDSRPRSPATRAPHCWPDGGSSTVTQAGSALLLRRRGHTLWGLQCRGRPTSDRSKYHGQARPDYFVRVARWPTEHVWCLKGGLFIVGREGRLARRFKPAGIRGR